MITVKIEIHKGRGKRMELTGYFVVTVGVRSHLVAGVYKRIGARFNGHFAEAFKMAMSTAR